MGHMSKKTSYRVRGLDCAEEVAVLKTLLGNREGILALDFDILNARMTVSHDPARISGDAIVAAVAAGGMTAVPWEERAAPPAESHWKRQGRLILTVASGALLAIGFAIHWTLSGSLSGALIAGETGRGRDALPLAVLLFYLGSIVAGAWYAAAKAVTAARQFRADMNLLMTVAIVGALAIGQWFEAATVAFLFALALVLEQWSLGRARRAIETLLDISPRMARTICPHDQDVVEKRVEEVEVDATVLVRPGEKIPLDGVVLRGSTTVNQAPITGESTPVAKTPGDDVFAATINEDGSFEFRVTKPFNDTTLAHLIHLVHEAQGRRAPAQRWVDRFAELYTPIMMALATLVILAPPLLWRGDWPEWTYRGLVMLVISCPCALVISTPVTIVSALAAAARNGVLIKGGLHLEAARTLRALCLDKTGTLTHGHPEVQEVFPLNGHTRQQILAKAAALETHSDHPLARAILRKAAAEGIDPPRAANVRATKGKGAEGEIDGRFFWIGSHRFLEEKGQEEPLVHDKAEQLEDAGHSVVIIGCADHVCGLISVADGVRDHARAALSDLKRLGIERIVMLTGDNLGTARAVAAATGVDEFRAELLPEDKLSAVTALVQSHGRVAMVGDGVNDAPAMAAATLGIAMGAMGADAAIETADVALMSDDLRKIPWLVGHSRRAFAVVRQNIVFALGLKSVFLVLALFGVATLWMAVGADMGASLLVIFNGLRLLRD
jgi:Cd2+/Zn2+-exporting ATPase